MSNMMHVVYEVCAINFRAVERHEDVSIVLTPEGFRLQYPPPYTRYSPPFESKRAAVWAAERFCAMRRRHHSPGGAM